MTIKKPEPVAWMSPSKERLEFSRKDTVYGSHTIPLVTESGVEAYAQAWVNDALERAAIECEYRGAATAADAIRTLKEQT